MPVKVYLKGGQSLLIRGESWPLATITHWWSRVAHAVGEMNGHEVRIYKREIIATEDIPDSEWKQMVEDQRKAEEEERKRNPNPGRRPGVWTPR